MKGKLIYWQGLLTILGAVAAPFGAWGSGQATLQAAIVLGVIAGLAALKNWFDSTLVPELDAEVVIPVQIPASTSVPAQAVAVPILLTSAQGSTPAAQADGSAQASVPAPASQPDAGTSTGASAPVVVPPAGPDGR